MREGFGYLVVSPERIACGGWGVERGNGVRYVYSINLIHLAGEISQLPTHLGAPNTQYQELT